MFYSYNITVTHATTETTSIQTEMKLSEGVIHQIDIIFPYNLDKDLYVRLLKQNVSLMPTNRRGAIRGHNTVISTREHIDLSAEDNILLCSAWNVNTTDDYLLTVNIGILPSRILQPFSFKELLAAALGLEEP